MSELLRDLADCLEDMTKHYVEVRNDLYGFEAGEEIEVVAAGKLIAEARRLPPNDVAEPVASRRWDKTYPGGQWLYFPPDHDGEKLVTLAQLAAVTAERDEALDTLNEYIEGTARLNAVHNALINEVWDVLIRDETREGGQNLVQRVRELDARATSVTAENARLREGWQDIESAPEGMQILVWETDYGWLLACKDRHHTTGWAGKSSGNFYWTMPQRVVDKLTHWRPLGDSPASQEAPK